MLNEIKVYGVDVTETEEGADYTQTSDFNEFMTEAERQGLIFTLPFFIQKLNDGEVNVSETFFRAGITKENEEVEEILLNSIITGVQEEDDYRTNIHVEIDKITDVCECEHCIENCTRCLGSSSCEFYEQLKAKEKELIYDDNDKIDQAQRLTERNTFDDIVKFITEQINEHALTYRHNISEGQLDTIKNIKKLYDKGLTGVNFTNEELEVINNACSNEFKTLCVLQEQQNEGYLNTEAIESRKTVLRKLIEKTLGY